MACQHQLLAGVDLFRDRAFSGSHEGSHIKRDREQCPRLVGQRSREQRQEGNWEKGCLGSRQLSLPVFTPWVLHCLPSGIMSHSCIYLANLPLLAPTNLERAPAPCRQLSILSTQTKTEATNQSLFTHRGRWKTPSPPPPPPPPQPTPRHALSPALQSLGIYTQSFLNIEV